MVVQEVVEVAHLMVEELPHQLVEAAPFVLSGVQGGHIQTMQLNLFDVYLIGPNGHPETHYAVEAENEFEAARLSPVMLTVNSHCTPDQYKVISVKESIHIKAEK